MLLIDTSGSMGEYLDNASHQRYMDAVFARSVTNPVALSPAQFGGRAIDKLREAVNQIQSSATEAIPMIAFGGPYDAQVRFVDVVPEPDGGTPLHLAIPLAKEYGATRLVVVSDGSPDLRDQSMSEARAFGGRIDVVFVGKPGDGGALYLKALAAATGGTMLQGDLSEVKKIASVIIGLLEGDVAPSTGRVFATDASGGATAQDAPEPVEPEDDDDEDDDDEEDDDDDDE
jgi:hypothetical protein